MARQFLSPAEIRLLAALPAAEAETVRALMDELDARMVETDAEDEQAALFDRLVA